MSSRRYQVPAGTRPLRGYLEGDTSSNSRQHEVQIIKKTQAFNEAAKKQAGSTKREVMVDVTRPKSVALKIFVASETCGFITHQPQERSGIARESRLLPIIQAEMECTARMLAKRGLYNE